MMTFCILLIKYALSVSLHSVTRPIAYYYYYYYYFLIFFKPSKNEGKKKIELAEDNVEPET